jgi:hypothetical protein
MLPAIARRVSIVPEGSSDCGYLARRVIVPRIEVVLPLLIVESGDPEDPFTRSLRFDSGYGVQLGHASRRFPHAAHASDRALRGSLSFASV